METKYNPITVETGRYKEWVEKELFKAESNSDKKPYTIVIPPPNVT